MVRKFDVRVVLSSKCNAKCPFCHHEGMTDQHLNFNNVMYYLSRLKEIGLIDAAITGGEPYDPDTALLVADMCKRLGYNTSLTTLGVYSDLTEMEKLAGLVDRFNISVPAFSPSLYEKWVGCSIDSLFNSIPLLKTLSRHLRINYTVTKLDSFNFDRVVEYAVNLGADLCIQDILWHPKFDLALYDELFLPALDFISPSKLNLSWQLCDGFSPRIKGKYNNTNIYIRSSYLNKLQVYSFCYDCPFKFICGERICGARIYGDSIISLCFAKRYSIPKRYSPDFDSTFNAIIDELNGILKST